MKETRMRCVWGTVCGEFVDGSGRQTKTTPGNRKEPYEAYAGRTLPSFYPRNEQKMAYVDVFSFVPGNGHENPKHSRPLRCNIL